MRHTKNDEDEEDEFFKNIATPFVLVGLVGLVVMIIRQFVIK